jgi:hypothetical protein
VQGTPKRAAGVKVAAIFCAAFVGAAVASFALAAALGRVLGAGLLGARALSGLAAAALALFAALDLLARARSTHLPLGWRRQTPRALLRRRSPAAVAAIWGFDTGLVVTTFRVAAVSWAALLLAALGLAPSGVGLAYGLGFTLPFAALIYRPALGRAAREGGAADPGLERLLARRGTAQAASAALLALAAALLAAEALA